MLGCFILKLVLCNLIAGWALGLTFRGVFMLFHYVQVSCLSNTFIDLLPSCVYFLNFQVILLRKYLAALIANIQFNSLHYSLYF